jgi:hypothetical protein
MLGSRYECPGIMRRMDGCKRLKGAANIFRCTVRLLLVEDQVCTQNLVTTWVLRMMVDHVGAAS